MSEENNRETVETADGIETGAAAAVSEESISSGDGNVYGETAMPKDSEDKISSAEDTMKETEEGDTMAPESGGSADPAGEGAFGSQESDGYAGADEEGADEASSDPAVEHLGSLDEDIRDIKDDIPDSSKEDPQFQGKASTKTTVVLALIILVLVGLICFFGYLIVSKLSDKKKEASNTDDTTVVSTQEGTTDNTADSTVSDDESAQVRKEYNVTVTPGQYKGIEIDFPEISISDDEIEYELEDFVNDLAENIPVEREAQDGDILNITYTATVDGEEFEDASNENEEFELGSHRFFDDFEDALVGKKTGDYTLELVFPEDYYEDVAGKPVTFAVTINSISERVVPELTDELIADNTEYSTVEAYKAYIRGYLEEEAINDAQDEVEEEILHIAVENSTFGGEIDEEIENLAQQYFDYYDQIAQAYYGVTGVELFAGMYGMSEEDYNDTIRYESGYSVKLQHLLAKVAEEENIEYTPEEYQEEFEDIFFSYYGYSDEDEVKAQLSEDEIEKMVSSSLVNRKAEDLIIDSAVITGKPVKQ